MPTMRVSYLLPLLLLLSAPAFAEKLSFDHRLYPPLKAVLDSGQTEMVLFDASNPRNIIDRIAVRGTSATRWTEALEIIARTPGKGVVSAEDWMRELRGAADKLCPNEAAILSQDDNSVTFERKSAQCPAERAPFAIYRIVGSKKSLFLLGVLTKEPLPAEMRQKWLELLATAHIE
jgi:hypothetical protein